MGFVVVGVDARDEGIALAKESGMNVVIDVRQGKEQVVEEVKKVTNGKGVDATVNISDAEEAATLSCAITKMHGNMIQIAQVGISLYPKTPYPLTPSKPPNVSVPFAELIFRDIRLKGSLISTRAAAQHMLEMVVEHKHLNENKPILRPASNSEIRGIGS